MKTPKFQPGDIVCFGDRSWLSRAIKWFTRSRGEPPTKCSHVGLMYDSEMVCEALRKVRIHPILTRLEESGWRQVYRATGLTKVQRKAIMLQCEYYKGKSYGWWKNLAHALDSLLGGYVFRRLLFMDRYPVCSWLVAWVYERCVKHFFFGLAANAVQPDDIHDACQDGERFTLIFTTTKGKAK